MRKCMTCANTSVVWPDIFWLKTIAGWLCQDCILEHYSIMMEKRVK